MNRYYRIEKDEDWTDNETATELIKIKGVFIKLSHLFARVLLDLKED